ncbi:MAG: hypothetical protein KDB22_17910, partial [Planctomycetales bacterium]|nr:hypothetical protein [Planctomycetales bacterium]
MRAAELLYVRNAIVRIVALVLPLLSWQPGACGQDGVWPDPTWTDADPKDEAMDPAAIERAVQYALSAGGSGMIVRHGRVVRRWGDQDKLYDIKSATKSFGATMLG